MDSSEEGAKDLKKHSCVTCAQKKIRCDRRQPCSSCLVSARTAARRRRRAGEATGEKPADSGCVYSDIPPAQHRRHKGPRWIQKTAAADDLLERLERYEQLLRENNIALTDASCSQEDRSQKSSDCAGRCGDSSNVNRNFSGTSTGDRVWIESPWMAKMATHVTHGATIATSQTPSSSSDKPVIAKSSSTGGGAGPHTPEADAVADVEYNLWQSLSPELRYPPVLSRFAHHFFNQLQDEENRQGTASPSHSTAETLLSMGGGSVRTQHPEPRLILRLWQIFVDKVNPLIRIVHVPTTHQHILEASWDAASAPPAMAAFMFSIYTLSLTVMSPEEYTATFSVSATGIPPRKAALLQQYRNAALQSLGAADLLATWRVDVLRSFTLLILAERNLEVASTLAAMAVHLAYKLGLHRVDRRHGENHGGHSIFEREMRLRLLWQVHGIAGRSRHALSFSQASGFNGNMFPPPDLSDLRLPLNVNDTDLHPDMTSEPVEHNGPTEMLFVRMKYETVVWISSFAQTWVTLGRQAPYRSDSDGGRPHSGQRLGSGLDLASMSSSKNRAVSALEELYRENYVQHCDPRIPLHSLTVNMTRLSLAKLRFQAFHPGSMVPLGSGPHAFSRKDADAAFGHALELLELTFACLHEPQLGRSYVAFQLLGDVIITDAVVYIISMLRVRTGVGRDSADRERVGLAWRVVEMFYEEFKGDLAMAISEPEQAPLQKSGNTDSGSDEGAIERRHMASAAFVTSLADLTLEAWAVRVASLGHDEKKNPTPAFITRLQTQNRERQGNSRANDSAVNAGTSGSADYSTDTVDLSFGPMVGVPGPDWLDGGDQAMDWEYWNTFLHI